MAAELNDTRLHISRSRQCQHMPGHLAQHSKRLQDPRHPYN
jgi:hypothetical protein